MEEKTQDSCILTNKFLYLHKNRCRTLKQIECIVNVKWNFILDNDIAKVPKQQKYIKFRKQEFLLLGVSIKCHIEHLFK